jgi:hypothetical protein
MDRKENRAGPANCRPKNTAEAWTEGKSEPHAPTAAPRTPAGHRPKEEAESDRTAAACKRLAAQAAKPPTGQTRPRRLEALGLCGHSREGGVAKHD